MADPAVEDVAVPNADDVENPSADDVEICNKVTSSSPPTTMGDGVLELAEDLESQSGVNLAVDVDVETLSPFEKCSTAEINNSSPQSSNEISDGQHKATAEDHDTQEIEDPSPLSKETQRRLARIEKILHDELDVNVNEWNSDDGESSQADSEESGSEESKSEKSYDADTGRIPISEYKEHIWSDFRYKYEDDNKAYAVEALVSSISQQTSAPSDARASTTTTENHIHTEDNGSPYATSSGNTTLLQQPLCIRISSWPLLAVFRKIGLTSSGPRRNRPWVMVRPYKWLWVKQNEIRDIHAELKAKFDLKKQAQRDQQREDADAALKEKSLASVSSGGPKEQPEQDQQGENAPSGDSRPGDESLAPTGSTGPNNQETESESRDPDGQVSQQYPTTQSEVERSLAQTHLSENVTASGITDSTQVAHGGAPEIVVIGSISSGHPVPEITDCNGALPAVTAPDQLPEETVPTDKKDDGPLTVEQKWIDTDIDSDDRYLDCPEALEDLSCLIEFFDRYITPYLELENGSSWRKVTFNDLWYVFKPGVDVCTSKFRESTGARDLLSNNKKDHHYQQVWRVLGTRGGHSRITTKTCEEENATARQKAAPLWIKAYYIDFNGSVYGSVAVDFKIDPFHGEKEVTTLPLYPLRYRKDYEEERRRLIENGRKFVEYQRPQHRHYAGPALVERPGGDNGFTQNQSILQEDIDSPVIVDFTMALQSHPTWASELGTTDILPPEPEDDIVEEPRCLETLYYRNKVARANKHPETTELVCTVFTNDGDHDYDYDRASNFVHRQQTFDIKEPSEDFFALTEDDWILLPTRVFAYILRARKFAQIEISRLKLIVKDKQAFADLKLRPGYKNNLQALVQSHFNAKEWAGDGNEEVDIVRGKGKGLIILLHGAPGVGKTSTAECIATHHAKPLLPITCADLGTKAQTVEAALDKIFTFAYRWDCILLLDEADVFLAKRTPSDLERNSLVSVFLRVLEYYRGILFLTTNRVGTFDDAFISRMHMMLHYPLLDAKQSKAIWKMNLERTTRLNDLRDSTNSAPATGFVFCDQAEQARIIQNAERHYEVTKASGGIWNARQIRNAFRTATALAEWEHGRSKNSKGSRPQLRCNHFDQVAEMSAKFDTYLRKTNGNQDESARALKRRERASEFAPDTTGGTMQEEQIRLPSGPFYGTPSRAQSSASDRSQRPPRHVSTEQERMGYSSRLSPRPMYNTPPFVKGQEPPISRRRAPENSMSLDYDEYGEEEEEVDDNDDRVHARQKSRGFHVQHVHDEEDSANYSD